MISLSWIIGFREWIHAEPEGLVQQSGNQALKQGAWTGVQAWVGIDFNEIDL